LAERLQRERNLQIVFLGDDQDRERIELIPGLGAGVIWNLAGRTTLAESAAILAGARIVVSNDSGPLHLGLALGSRAVAFFGPTVGAFGFAPVGHPRAVVIEKKMSCRPCSLHGSRACPLGHHACLRSISVEETFAAIACLLDTPGGKQQKGANRTC
jgi:heptosyltransferase-2